MPITPNTGSLFHAETQPLAPTPRRRTVWLVWLLSHSFEVFGIWSSSRCQAPHSDLTAAMCVLSGVSGLPSAPRWPQYGEFGPPSRHDANEKRTRLDLTDATHAEPPRLQPRASWRDAGATAAAGSGTGRNSVCYCIARGFNRTQDRLADAHNDVVAARNGIEFVVTQLFSRRIHCCLLVQDDVLVQLNAVTGDGRSFAKAVNAYIEKKLCSS
jgi:hypothetical protein